MEKIAFYIKDLKNVQKVTILPYHNFALSKYQALGLEENLPKNLPESDQIAKIKNLFKID